MRRRILLGILVLVAAALLAATFGSTSLKRFAYESFGRDGWQHPDRVIGSLGIQSGDHIADLGSGGGYFTFRLAEAVSPNGKVYAVDVDSEMNEYVEERAREERYGNIETILAEYHDPLLPEGEIDLIFTCNTYHHIEERVAYFSRAKRYLRAEGRIAIIEFSGKGWFQRLFSHSTDRDVIRGEMEAAGYRLESKYDYLPRQHFLVFSKVSE
jgi:ubiquinone/menaquinone biosynthesis C-methylase UbiE